MVQCVDIYVLTISNDLSADNLRFNFSHDTSTDKYGYLDTNGNFVPFESGGTDVSDTTATAATVLSGYYFYTSDAIKTQGTYVPLDTSDATATADKIKSPYTAYVNGVKITGTIPGTLKKTTATNLLQAAAYLAATSIGNYALFGGGSTGGQYVQGAEWFYIINVYNNSLSRSNPIALSEARGELAATSNSTYALFGGGNSGDYSSRKNYNTVDAYNRSLSRSTPAVLPMAAFNLGATSIGSYALFGGGYANAKFNSVETYNRSLSRSTASSLSDSKYYLAATSTEIYALIGGGCSSNTNYSAIIDAYYED